jgi:hypothetical protein
MNKLRLKLEDLQIDSFSTTPVKKEKGTVYGEQCTCRTACTCPGCPTCDASCNGTCDASCNGTCVASCNGTCGDSCGCPTYDDSCNSCYYGCYTYQTRGEQGYCELCAAW